MGTTKETTHNERNGISRVNQSVVDGSSDEGGRCQVSTISNEK